MSSRWQFFPTQSYIFCGRENWQIIRGAGEPPPLGSIKTSAVLGEHHKVLLLDMKVDSLPGLAAPLFNMCRKFENYDQHGLTSLFICECGFYVPFDDLKTCTRVWCKKMCQYDPMTLRDICQFDTELDLKMDKITNFFNFQASVFISQDRQVRGRRGTIQWSY